MKLETSAESRGAFNKFLGTLPSNGAIAPIQTGVVPSSTAPVTPMTGNVNIFQPQMSQMTAMPMMPPAQPVQMMFNGGEVDDAFDDFGDFSGIDTPLIQTLVVEMITLTKDLLKKKIQIELVIIKQMTVASLLAQVVTIVLHQL